ncbi:HAD family phosphatase [Nocardiopsis sp. EMB25]|uniref:HAD family hydrolase n=1 Tax=Nocardiopsis sp. EMB25 TaxID=2835867 RepID=UPI0022849FE5|nr:HAD family phosphatase [Nocardiopsis sp. EMB25]MCY9785547.1 HAD family phosphatase [Nocardiopsis sp. EMB25]
MNGTRRGVISDWGGVLTTPLLDSIGAWLHDERIDHAHYQRVMRPYFDGSLDGNNPVHALERGEIDTARFERDLAELLKLTDGGPVVAEGLIHRMFARFEPVHEMYETLRAVRRTGVGTALLSNSWGNGYPREHFDSTFDEIVISGEVGMRKPEPRIYLHTCERLGLRPQDCVFIDDLPHNIDTAEELGMTGILHTDAATTRSELDRLLAPDTTHGPPNGSDPSNTPDARDSRAA